MSLTGIIGDHTFLIGFVMVGSYFVWTFILKPIMNEGKPIEPTEDDLKPLSEKMGMTDLLDGFDTETDL